MSRIRPYQVSKRVAIYSHNVHGYDAEHLGRRPAIAGAVLIKSHAAMCRSRRQFVASHDRVALERALGLEVIHFGKPLAQLRVLKRDKRMKKLIIGFKSS